MNFFTDNDDIKFLLGHLDMARIADLAEHGFRFRSDFDFAPKDADDALDNGTDFGRNELVLCLR